MIYLASPYSHSDPLIRKTRFLLAEEFVAKNFPEHIYSPVVHYHELSLRHNIPGDFATWQKINFDMIRRADEFWILDIPGWEDSVGVTAEAKFALDCGFRLRMVHGSIYPWQG